MPSQVLSTSNRYYFLLFLLIIYVITESLFLMNLIFLKMEVQFKGFSFIQNIMSGTVLHINYSILTECFQGKIYG